MTNLPPSLSEVNCVMTCWQQWFWRYIRKIQRPLRPEPMEKGSLIHHGLAVYYGKYPHDVITASQAMYTLGNRDWEHYSTLAVAEPDADEAKKFQAMLVQCERILKLYDQHYQGEQLSIGGVETEFTYPLHRIVDMVTMDDNGLVWAWEHKTSSKMPELSALTATMEPALTCLACGANGIIYNIITTDPIKFARQDFTISQEQKDYALNWYQHISGIITAQYEFQKHHGSYFEFPVHNRTCNWCEYLKLCQLMSSGRDTEEAMARLYIPKRDRDREVDTDG